MFACACATTPPQGEGKLQRATDKVTGPSSTSSSGSGGSHGGHGGYHDEDDEFFAQLFGELLGEVAWDVFGTPFWVPHVLMEANPGSMDPGFYLPHPYARGDEPFVSRSMSDAQGDRSAWSLRTALEYGTDFDGVERIGTMARIETAVRFGLEAEWNHYREDLPGGGSDTLNLGDANLIYRFAQGDRGEMRTGIGLNWFADGPARDYGFNFTYGGDFHVGDPWITSFEIDLGTVGDATRFHGRATVGAVWGPCELTAGFDYESLDSVGLPSWSVGMRIWL